MNKSLFRALLAVTFMSSMASVSAAAAKLTAIQQNAFRAASVDTLVEVIGATDLTVDDTNITSRNLGKAATLIIGNAAATLTARLASTAVANEADDETRLASYSAAANRMNEQIIAAVNTHPQLKAHAGWLRTHLASEGTTVSLVENMMAAGKVLTDAIAGFCTDAAAYVAEKVTAVRQGISGIIDAVKRCPMVSRAPDDYDNA